MVRPLRVSVSVWHVFHQVVFAGCVCAAEYLGALAAHNDDDAGFHGRFDATEEILLLLWCVAY